jgi:hypothetical protein
MRFQHVLVLVLLLSMMGCSANVTNILDDQMMNIGTHRLCIWQGEEHGD